MPQSLYRGQGQLEMIVSYHHVGPTDWAQVIRFSCRPLYPLSHWTYLHLIVWDNAHLGPWNLLIWLDWVARETQGSSCLGPSSSGVTGACFHHWPYTQVLEIEPGPQASAARTFLRCAPPHCWPYFQRRVCNLETVAFQLPHTTVLESCVSHVSWAMEAMIMLPLCAEIIHLFCASSACLVLNKS